MGLRIGLDIGTVSAKLAVVGPAERLESLASGPLEELVSHPSKGGESIGLSRYLRIQGRPLEAAGTLLGELFACLEAEEIESVMATGSAGKLVGGAFGIPYENEFKSAAFGVGTLHPDARNIFEMGGENSKYIKLSAENEMIGIVDYETNGDCAAGTGSFMDQQASRLMFDIEEVGDLVLATERTPKIAGRCSVFAKSEVLKGLCAAVARNFKSNIARGKEVHGRTAFIGGVALNKGVAEALKTTFELSDEDFFIPEHAIYMGAVGAALIAAPDGLDPNELQRRVQEGSDATGSRFPSWKVLCRDRVLFLRDRVDEFSFEGRELPVDAYLGIDVGSVSTNLALMDDSGKVIKEIYLRTQARPIEVVHYGLQ